VEDIGCVLEAVADKLGLRTTLMAERREMELRGVRVNMERMNTDGKEKEEKKRKRGCNNT